MIRMDRRQFLTLPAGPVALAWTPRIAYAQGMITPGETDVLAVIDVQNCFVPGGTLPVPEGDRIIPIINRLAPAFRHVVITQDWHTKGHISFASSHPGKKPFETTSLPYGTQVLWPDHCIQRACSSSGSPPISAWRGRRSTRARPASRPWSSRTPHAGSTPAGRSARRGRT